MRIVLGQPPEVPFEPEKGDWRKLRDPGPALIWGVGGVLGGAMCILILFLWPADAPDGTLQLDIGAARQQFPFIALGWVWQGLAFLAAVALAHELVHVLACPRFGRTPSTILSFVPARCVVFTCHVGAIATFRFLLVLLAPLVILSGGPALIACATGNRALLRAVSATSALMSGGDILIAAAIVLQVPMRSVLWNQGWQTWWRPPGSCTDRLLTLIQKSPDSNDAASDPELDIVD